LLDPRDNLNQRALDLAVVLAGDGAQLITTDAVVLEFANYFARSPLRGHASKWITALRADPGWEIVAVDRDLLLRSEGRYARHADKAWSLTGCHSMEVMRARRIREVATTDLGFEQAGFRCLLR
jgi:predicted nucleic acid-binding protein